MDHATVALFLAFSCAAAVAAVGAATAPFGYPDDDHVIITQHGPVRYEPMSADQLNRPYEHGGVRVVPARGYYKAEVIPLDMKTWKPLSGDWTAPVAGPSGARAVSVGTARPAGSGRIDAFDVPLRVGYSVRPAKRARPRRHNYLVASLPHGQHLHRYPGARSSSLPPPRPAEQPVWRP